MLNFVAIRAMAADTETARNIHVRISTSGVLSVAVISSCDGSMMAREFTMAVRATLHFHRGLRVEDKLQYHGIILE